MVPKAGGWRKRPEFESPLKIGVLLEPFVRHGQLQVWADRYIKMGDMWRCSIDEAVVRTFVGVVFLTSDLLASDFIADVSCRTSCALHAPPT